VYKNGQGKIADLMAVTSKISLY